MSQNKKRMVLVDASNFFTIVTSSLFSHANDIYDIHGVRDAILTSLFNHVKEYQTGNIVLALDSSKSTLWRRDVLPSYKFKRDIPQELKSGQFDRREAFQKFINPIQEEIINHLPFMVMKVDRCEADDIIGTMTDLCYTSGNSDVIISSADSDFDQLIVGRNGENGTHVVRICLENFQLVYKEPKFDSLNEMIIRGATKDSVPNAYSPDNFLTDQYENPEAKMRQKAVSKKVLAAVGDDIDKIKAEFPFFERNQKLIDLMYVPDDIKAQIKADYVSKFKEKQFKLDGVEAYLDNVGAGQLVKDLYSRIKVYL